MTSWRPDRLDDILGQQKIVDSLKISIKSADIRNHALPHMCLEGPPGLGKTSVAKAISNELGVKMHVVLGSNMTNSSPP